MTTITEKPRAVSLTDKVWVAGHKGMVGSAIVRRLREQGYENIVTVDRKQLDLTDSNAVRAFLRTEKVDQIYLAAAKVGGIGANNSYPADFIYDNLMIEANIIHGAHSAGIQRLVFLGSSCIYPRLAPQPIKEEALLTGELEPTNEPYAIAKIAGIKLCESYNRQFGRDYRSVMPTNLYGPNDNFHPENSHVIPALMRRFHEATINGDKEILVWGSGTPRREFLHVDDMAAACVYIMELSSGQLSSHVQPMLSHINVGTGVDCSIRDLVYMLGDLTGFRGDIRFDKSKPDGTPRKLLDVKRANALGWTASIGLKEGLQATYQWYVANIADIRSS